MTRWRVAEAAEITARLKGASRQRAVDHRHQHQPLAPFTGAAIAQPCDHFARPARADLLAHRGRGRLYAGSTFLHHAGCIAIGLFGGCGGNRISVREREFWGGGVLCKLKK